jgi:hypothetical protein
MVVFPDSPSLFGLFGHIYIIGRGEPRNFFYNIFVSCLLLLHHNCKGLVECIRALRKVINTGNAAGTNLFEVAMEKV